MITSWVKWRRRLRKRSSPPSTRQRIGWVRLFSIALVLLLTGRLFQLQVVQNAFWEGQAELARRRIEPIAAERGRLLDRRGRVLAGTRRSYDVVLDVERLLGHCEPLQVAETLTVLRLAFVPVAEVLADPHAHLDELLDVSPATLAAIEDPGLRYETRTWLQRLLQEAVDDVRGLRGALRAEDERSLAALLAPDRAALDAAQELWATRFTSLEQAIGQAPGSLAACLDERRIQFLQWWGRRAEHLRRETSMPDEDVARERVAWFESRRRQATVYHADCAYDPIVPLLAMDPEGFAGIRADAKDRRDYPVPVAPEVLGMAAEPSGDLIELFRQSRQEIDRLRRLVHRSPADQARLDELVEAFRVDEYWPGDLVGQRGLEARLEDVLRGERGYREAEWNRQTRDTTASPLHKAAVPGADVVLTLDAALQEAAERVLGMTALPVKHDAPVESYVRAPRAALVVVEIATGDLLVLASYPTWTREEYRSAYPALAERADRPLHPAAFAPWRVPVPGSLLKPVYALEAFLEPGFSPHQSVFCDGRWGTNGPRCNNRTGHGSTDLVESLRRSCNLYYFHLATEHGPYRLLGALERFGFGRPSGAELAGELGGRVPGPPDRVRGGALLNVAIGQGEVEATPLQIAIAFAGIASGRVPQARLVRAVNGVDRAVATRELPYPEHAFRAVHAGMVAVCRPGGTASVVAELPFSFAGKSGTAQAGGERPDHSWFAGFFPAEAPRYAICAFAEECGVGGGKFAAPLAVTFLQTDAARVLWPEGHQR